MIQNETTAPLLSKWWKTKSAQAALERSKHERKERIKKVRESFAAKQARMKNEVESWEVVAI